jgi:glutathione synthase/RimK-type ligase-like ATP-grasp enzyme
MSIVIFGAESFPSIRKVVSYIEEMDEKTIVIDFDKKPSETIAIDFNNNHISQEMLNPSDVTVAWSYEKFSTPEFGDTQEWAREYVTTYGWRGFYKNYTSLLSCPIINSESSKLVCSSKLRQLKIASQIGFKVPPSLLSSNIDAICQWSREQGGAITKSIYARHYPLIGKSKKQQYFFTTKLDEDLMKANAGLIEDFPIFCQKELKKKFEYRLVLVKDEVFSFRIDPSQHSLMATDHRMGLEYFDYEPYEIKDSIKEKVVCFAKQIGLFMGCFDIIQTNDDEYYFLEVNPDGIWDRNDDQIEHAISKKIATELVKLAIDSSRT